MKTSLLRPFLLSCVALGLGAHLPAADDRESTLRFPANELKRDFFADPTPDADYQHASPEAYAAFRGMKFGVRIHWGLYSLLPAARESWTFLELSDADRQKYLESYRQWNPQGFNAEEWMNFFDRAGFRCFTITTKHHEGFSLFDTKARVLRRPNYAAPGGVAIEDTDVAYSVMETPFKRDIVKELCDSAHRHGIKIDLYFSHSDWYDADFRPYGVHPLLTEKGDRKTLEERQKRPAGLFPNPTPEQRQHMMERERTQLRELLTNYGKVDMVCLDVRLGAEVWAQERETIKELRKIQPDVMFRNRGIGNYGDFYTPERVVPGEASDGVMPWMVIYPLGTNFSWEGDATKYKGAKWVVDNLVDCIAKGGNFMVGIGPDGNGRFHPTAIAQLEEVGAWLKVNNDSVFKSHRRTGEGWKDGDDVRLTEADEGGSVYAFLLKRPAGSFTLKGIHPVAGSTVSLIGQAGALTWRDSAEGATFDFPQAAANSLAYVIKVRMNP